MSADPTMTHEPADQVAPIPDREPFVYEDDNDTLADWSSFTDRLLYIEALKRREDAIKAERAEVTELLAKEIEGTSGVITDTESSKTFKVTKVQSATTEVDLDDLKRRNLVAWEASTKRVLDARKFKAAMKTHLTNHQVADMLAKGTLSFKDKRPYFRFTDITPKPSEDETPDDLPNLGPVA